MLSSDTLCMALGEARADAMHGRRDGSDGHSGNGMALGCRLREHAGAGANQSGATHRAMEQRGTHTGA